MQTSSTSVKCLIIGSGPAGYTAAIYTGRAGIDTLLLEGDIPGGQLTQTTDIENFPGYPDGITGFDMMDDMKRQAERFGGRFITDSLQSIDLTQRPYVAQTTGGETITADTVIIATGASPKYLGLDDEKKYAGKGVSACATCDGFFYRKKRVAVVGGGDTACEEAVYLASLAEKVYLIVRRNELRASKIMRIRVESTENIEILYEHETLGLYGEGKLEGANLIYRKGTADEKQVDLPIQGFFLAIGHHPNADLFASGQSISKGVGDLTVMPHIKTDEQGYIITDGIRPLTNLPGIFAAGDVADPLYRQAITAAASGCRAAMEAERYLSTI